LTLTFSRLITTRAPAPALFTCVWRIFSSLKNDFLFLTKIIIIIYNVGMSLGGTVRGKPKEKILVNCFSLIITAGSLEEVHDE
jgi:hypothetical protein